MRLLPARISSWLAAAVLVLASGCKNDTADMLLINGVVHTLDAHESVTQAIAIRDGKVVGTGTTDDLIFRFAADTTIDLKGKAVYPGLIDAHCHFVGYARQKSRIDLTGTQSFEEVLSLVDSFAQQMETEWVLGRGWDQNDWPGQSFPTNAELNRKFPDRPVFLKRIDGHAALANDAALRLAGITGNTRMTGGKVIAQNGRPTGILIDNAVDWVDKVVPKESEQELTRWLLEAQSDMFKVGLTTLDDAGLDWSDIELLDKLQQAGLLKIRVYAMANPSEENFEKLSQTGPYKTDRLNVRSFKVYADGALGSRGACLLEPYKDAPGNYGFMLKPLDYYQEIAQRIHDAGFQMNTHCIGDSATRFILRTYSQVLAPGEDARWRIEHAQIVHPADLAKFRTYGIIPSVQPTHATSDMPWAKDRIGKIRIKTAYAYKNLLSQNGMIAFGSDFPVESINPLEGLFSAVARTDHSGYPFEGGFQPENAVSRNEAIKAMTIWAAAANFEEEEKGSLEPGKFADLVVLDRDIEFCNEKEIWQTTVLRTMVNGEWVHIIE